MEISRLRLIYMGTPGFAVAPLERLLEAGCSVTVVVTAPDRPAGRGMKVRYSAVKECAVRHNIPVLQPPNLKDPDFLQKLTNLAPDLQVVVAFRMLPEMVWRIPRLGTFNLHASLLPQYRGAAPINHVIMNGEEVTGVTTFMIDEQIDTGNILLRQSIPIGERESAGELHDRLMKIGADLVLETVSQLAAGELKARPQDEFMDEGAVLKKAPKIHREDCRIRWDRPGKEVFNRIRGLSPYPGAFTHLSRDDGTPVLCKIFSSFFEEVHGRDAGTAGPPAPPEAPGTILTDGRKYLKVAVKDGYLHITSLQQEGKKRMGIVNFLAGISWTSFQPRFS